MEFTSQNVTPTTTKVFVNAVVSSLAVTVDFVHTSLTCFRTRFLYPQHLAAQLLLEMIYCFMVCNRTAWCFLEVELLSSATKVSYQAVQSIQC